MFVLFKNELININEILYCAKKMLQNYYVIRFKNSEHGMILNSADYFEFIDLLKSKNVMLVIND